MTTDTDFFNRVDDEDWDTDSGKPGIGLFARAVQVWSVYQDHPVSISSAAAAFRCDPQVIIEAIEWHPWMDTLGPPDDFDRMTIYHEGE